MTTPAIGTGAAPMSLAERLAESKRLEKELRRQEETSVLGANSMTPKQALLDVRGVQERNPDLRVRWVNLKNPEKVLSRQHDGYEVLPADKGGKKLGDDYVLMGIPRAKYEARVRAQDKMAKDRLSQHKSEMEKLAEQVARQLRDNHGIDISPERLLVNEG